MRKKITIFTILLLVSAATLLSQTVQRKVFFEGFTSATCNPCNAYNAAFHTYLLAKGDSIVNVEYHQNWPTPGNDSMYWYNPTENLGRRSYYGVSTLPWMFFDGLNGDYASGASFWNSRFYPRLAILTPVQITVVNTRVPGDSIRANITVTNLSALPAGTYKLRVMAVEKTVWFPVPFNNGEQTFYNVFRKFYPDINGTTHPITAGTFNYTITYKIDMLKWKADSMYTIACIQNDGTKEIMNVAGKWSFLSRITQTGSEIPEKYNLHQNYPNPFNPVTSINFSIPKENNCVLRIYDMLGREVTTLVSEKLKAGMYKATWDATGFSSGVYYYKLTSGDFTQIKKMMLLK